MFPVAPKWSKASNTINQQEFNSLVAIWKAASLRPFQILEDNGLQRVIDFASSVDGILELPSININKNVMN